MSNYVDTNYSSSYVEGDTPSNNVQAVTNEDIQFLKDEIATLKTMLLNVTSTLANLPTQDFINNKIPFVDNMSLKIFPNGTNVVVAGFDGICEVISSSYLPFEDYTYIVVYTVSAVENGITKISNFSANQVAEYIPKSTT